MSSKVSEGKKKEIRDFVRKELEDDQEPLFYALSGSHLYGFPSKEGGDIDIRGFHMTDSEEFLKLGASEEQVEIEKEWESSFEQSKMDLVSYELKKFGHLVFKTNFNVLEWLSGDNIVWNRREEEIEELRQKLEEHLPADVPYHYKGMAKQNYNRFLVESSGSYKPTAKKYLYVLRGLLGAKYIQENETIEPDITKLADYLLSKEDAKIIDDLIQEKQKEKSEADPETASRADDLIQRLFDEVEAESSKDDEKLTEQINEWMLDVRREK